MEPQSEAAWNVSHATERPESVSIVKSADAHDAYSCGGPLEVAPHASLDL